MLFVCLPGELAEQEEKEPHLRSSPPSKEGEIVCAATLIEFSMLSEFQLVENVNFSSFISFRFVLSWQTCG